MLPLDSSSPMADALLSGRSCPAPLRAEAQRALAMRLERAVVELGHCVASAMEIDRPVTARRIESVRLRASELSGLVREDWR